MREACEDAEEMRPVDETVSSRNSSRDDSKISLVNSARSYEPLLNWELEPNQDGRCAIMPKQELRCCIKGAVDGEEEASIVCSRVEKMSRISSSSLPGAIRTFTQQKANMELYARKKSTCYFLTNPRELTMGQHTRAVGVPFSEIREHSCVGIVCRRDLTRLLHGSFRLRL